MWFEGYHLFAVVMLVRSEKLVCVVLFNVADMLYPNWYSWSFLEEGGIGHFIKIECNHLW